MWINVTEMLRDFDIFEYFARRLRIIISLSVVFNSYNRLAALARTRQSAPPLPSSSLVISMISSTDSSREGDIFRVQSFARILKLAATREKFIRNIVPTTFLTWLDVRLVVSKIN